MSWKNIKDAYRIGHIVQIREGRICIGSAYVSDLIRITFEGEVSWGNMGPRSDGDLARYYAEMVADLDRLKRLIDGPDLFREARTVFTYDGAEIIEKQCEEYGWPNVTHDGLLMYENTFSPDRAKVVEWAKKDAAGGVEWRARRIEELKRDLAKVEEGRDRCAGYLAKLEGKDPPPPSVPVAECDRLLAAIVKHHAQRADDRCFLDDDELYAAAGLEPVDRRVGDKVAMLENCKRFLERRCEGGGPWKSYAELEAELERWKAWAEYASERFKTETGKDLQTGAA